MTSHCTICGAPTDLALSDVLTENRIAEFTIPLIGTCGERKCVDQQMDRILRDYKYADTVAGVLSMLREESNQSLHKYLDATARVQRDPSVAGVWLVGLRNGQSIIAYLAGYPDAMGRVRTENDFEVG